MLAARLANLLPREWNITPTSWSCLTPSILLSCCLYCSFTWQLTCTLDYDCFADHSLSSLVYQSCWSSFILLYYHPLR